jgi:adenosylmethionine-8-amino-7-oxononanoate aminotransferase
VTRSVNPVVPEKVELLARTLERRVAILPAVTRIRQSGLVVAVELQEPHPGRGIAREVALAVRRRGGMARVSGAAVMLTPSPSSSEAELHRAVAVLASSIAEVALSQMPAAA